MSNIGVIGHGYVGKAIEYGFRGVGHDFFIYDKYKSSKSLEEVVEKSSILFMCLPTPFDEDKLEIDLSIYDDMIDKICPNLENQGKIVVIKSTVVPGTTMRYAKKYPAVPFAFNPEFLTETNYLTDFVNSERIVIGTDNDWVAQDINMLYKSAPCFAQTPVLKMTTTAAEIVKYQANILLACKVAVSNVCYDVCEKFNVKYDDVKQAVSMDSRIGNSHLSVTSERGFGGKCFVKDIAAFIGACKEMGVDAKVLEEVYDYNLRIRKVHDWKEIAGATVGGRDYSRSELF